MESALSDVSAGPLCLPGPWSPPPWGLPSHPLRGPSPVHRVEAPALPSDEGQLTCHQLSLPPVGNQRAQACVWRAWMGNLPHVVCTGPKPTRDSKIRPWSAERGFQNHRARAPCSCLESLYHERLPWPAVCPLGGVLPEPHRWWPLKMHVPSGDTVVSMTSPASSLELSSLMGRTQLPQEGSGPPLFHR